MVTVNGNLLLLVGPRRILVFDTLAEEWNFIPTPMEIQGEEKYSNLHPRDLTIKENGTSLSETVLGVHWHPGSWRATKTKFGQGAVSYAPNLFLLSIL